MNPQRADAAGWPLVIGYRILLRRRQEEVLQFGDVLVPPGSGASQEAIAAVEERYGPLEATYRSFLGHVDGWEGFTFNISLLGTDALVHERIRGDVEHYLQMCEVEVEDIDPGEVMPLTTVSPDADLVMVWRAGTARAGQVTWWSPHGEVERYPNFAAYVAGQNELVERSLEKRGASRVAPRVAYDDLRDLGGSEEQVTIARMITADVEASWTMATITGALAGVKAALTDRGQGEVWGGVRAERGADGEAVRAVQRLYSMALYSDHAELLYAVDGWERLLVSLDLLSAAQLQDPQLVAPAVAHMRAVLAANSIEAGGHVVIACAADSSETVVVDGRQVLWLRGDDQIAARYPSVRHWMLRVLTAHLQALDETSAGPSTLHSPL